MHVDMPSASTLRALILGTRQYEVGRALWRDRAHCLHQEPSVGAVRPYMFRRLLCELLRQIEPPFTEAI